MKRKYFGTSGCLGKPAFAMFQGLGVGVLLVGCSLDVSALNKGGLSGSDSGVDNRAGDAGSGPWSPSAERDAEAGTTDDAEPGMSLESVTASDPFAGASGVTLTVVGRGFAPGARLTLDGRIYPVTLASGKATAGPVDLPSVASNYPVVVKNLDGSSAVGALVVNNRVPTIANVRVSSTILGATNVTVTVTGSDFVSGVRAKFGSSACLPPCAVTLSDGTLSFGPVSLPDAGQEVPITLTNPSPTLGSATASLVVSWPAISVSSARLSKDEPGASGVTLTIFGSNFAPDATVEFPPGFASSDPFGSSGPRTATRNSAGTELSVTDLTLPSEPGVYKLAVTNPSPTFGAPGEAKVSVVGDGTSCAAAASVDGVNNCGNGTESCCTSLAVPEGTFLRSHNYVESTDDSFPATVSNYRLDKYEVTVGRIRPFIDAWVAGWRPAAGNGKHRHLNGGQGLSDTGGGLEPGWDVQWAMALGNNKAEWDANLSCDATTQTWTSGAGALERKPINCLDWPAAYAFCIWDGGFLPSEAEWNYAASGGSEQREYPWSNDENGTSAGATFHVFQQAEAANVGSRPKGEGKWAQLDLGGNVEEWNLDGFAPYANPCKDCVALWSGTSRVHRGGFFGGFSFDARASNRSSGFAPGDRKRVGVRCARPPLSACHGHGTPSASGTCTCAANWAGDDCSVCAPGLKGASCDISNAITCRGHGTALEDGTCICATGYAGSHCTACDTDYTDSNGAASGGTCVATPVGSANSCDAQYTDSNGVAFGGTCIPAVENSGAGNACDIGYFDANGSTAGGSCVPIRKSCSEILADFPSAPTGVYKIDPDGPSSAVFGAMNAFCDMNTDGGGWTQVLNYVHLGHVSNPPLLLRGTDLPVQTSSTLGADESASQGAGGAWGHATPELMASLNAKDVRFYCQTSAHGRVMHFKTSLGPCVDYLGSGAGSCTGLASSYTTLAGHSAKLPAAAAGYFENQGNGALTEFPFFLVNFHHWGIRGGFDRWECDVLPGGPQFNTLNRVWVR